MKVCMVYPFDFPGFENWEGSRSRLVSLSEGLVDRGVEVHILCGKDRLYQRSSMDGIRLHELRKHENKRLSSIVSSILVGEEVLRLHHMHHFDIVHAHLAVMAASLAMWRPLIGSKVVFDTHDWFKLNDELYFNLPFLPRFISGAVDGVERIIARRQDGVLVTTPLLLKLLRNGGRVFEVPNAVDTDLFKPSKSRFRETFFKESHLVIGFLGFVSIHQGLWKLLHALRMISKEIRDVKLLVVGGGFVDDAKALARSLGISERIIFTGPSRVPRLEIPDLINAMDIAVSPLQAAPRYQEYAQPLKLLEYLACGKPVVVTPLHEQRRIVSEASGGVVASSFEYEDLAAAISRIVREGGVGQGSEERRSYIIRKHSTGVVLDRLLSAYNELTGR